MNLWFLPIMKQQQKVRRSGNREIVPAGRRVLEEVGDEWEDLAAAGSPLRVGTCSPGGLTGHTALILMPAWPCGVSSLQPLHQSLVRSGDDPGQAFRFRGAGQGTLPASVSLSAKQCVDDGVSGLSMSPQKDLHFCLCVF